MKRGYKRLLIFELILLIILILNSFVSNILKDYIFILFLAFVIGIFEVIFGIEKDRHRYTKDIIFEEIIFLMAFLLIYYLSGLLIGFARTQNYYSFQALFAIFIPSIVIICLKEFLRYNLLNKAEGNNLLIILTCILFIVIDAKDYFNFELFKNVNTGFEFFAINLLPIISTNIACTYLTNKVGYKPVILYLLVMEFYQFLLPIVPNPSGYLVSIIGIIVPVALSYRVHNIFKKYKDEDVERDKKPIVLTSYIITTLIIVVMVYFTSGYFHYYAVAVVSGSMEPTIHIGDVVIVEKVEDNYDKLKIGEVLVFNYEGVTIVHRIVNIIEDNGHYYFYTKGDANNAPDNFTLTEKNVVGITNLKIPMIGLPATWLNKLR